MHHDPNEIEDEARADRRFAVFIAGCALALIWLDLMWTVLERTGQI